MTSRRPISQLSRYFNMELEKARRNLTKAANAFERATLDLQAASLKENESYERLTDARERFDKLEAIVMSM